MPEADSPEFERYAGNPSATFVTASIASWEAHATFRRKESEGGIKPGTTQTLHAELLADIKVGEWRIVEPDNAVADEFARVLDLCAGQNPPLLIRTLDAIHLAFARMAGETEIVATDKRLRAAAIALGFTLFPK